MGGMAANMRPILPTDSLLAENIRLRRQLADVETGNLTIAIQECAELRDQRGALTLRLQASEQERFALKAQVQRVREALDGFEYEMDCDAGVYRQASAFELRAAIRAALDPPADQEVPDE